MRTKVFDLLFLFAISSKIAKKEARMSSSERKKVMFYFGKPRRIELAVLVDRRKKQRELPIKATYVARERET